MINTSFIDVYISIRKNVNVIFFLGLIFIRTGDLTPLKPKSPKVGRFFKNHAKAPKCADYPGRFFENRFLKNHAKNPKSPYS